MTACIWPPADHSLEVEDWRRSLRQHEQVAATVAEFARELLESDVPHGHA